MMVDPCWSLQMVRAHRRNLQAFVEALPVRVSGMAITLLFLAPVALAAEEGPCDILAAAGTPCVAAHSTARALYGTYAGPLYEVQRASDGKRLSILAANGVADAAAQDAFCSGVSSPRATDPLDCFAEEPEAAQLPNVCFGGYDVKTESNSSADCAAKCLADPKCLSFVKATATYSDPHACRLSHTCAAPTSFLAGFDGFVRKIAQAECALPGGAGCTGGAGGEKTGKTPRCAGRSLVPLQPWRVCPRTSR